MVIIIETKIICIIFMQQFSQYNAQQLLPVKVAMRCDVNDVLGKEVYKDIQDR